MSLPKLSLALLPAALLFTSSVAAAEPDLAPLPAPSAAAWYELIELSAFIDGYAAANYNFPKPNAGASSGRLFDRDTGFALGWVGVDASYPAEPVGGTVSLRLGPNAELLGADEPGSLRLVKQAFASFRPGGPKGPLRLDFGKFSSPYGVEAAESQLNHQYSRGLVFTHITPFTLTGLRLAWELGDVIELSALAVNGWNRSLDHNTGKTFGLQLVVKPSRRLDLKLGWLGGPEQPDVRSVSCPDDTSYQAGLARCAPAVGTPAADYTVHRDEPGELDDWRHLVDAVLLWRPTDALDLYGSFSATSDYVPPSQHESESEGHLVLLGAALGARYALSDAWAVAGRGEYFKSGFLQGGGEPRELKPWSYHDLSMSVASASLTLELRPTEHLILRLENRGDFALSGAAYQPARSGSRLFNQGARDTGDTQLTTTLGVVLTTH